MNLYQIVECRCGNDAWRLGHIEKKEQLVEYDCVHCGHVVYVRLSRDQINFLRGE